MAKGRMLSKSISISEKVNEVLPPLMERAGFTDPYLGVLLYSWLHPHADDFGRMEGSNYNIKMTIMPGLPVTKEQIKVVLRCLHDAGLIVLYAVDGKEYIQIVNFEKHQSGLHKKTKSIFPEFPGNSGNDVECAGTSGNALEDLGNSGVELEQEIEQEQEKTENISHVVDCEKINQQHDGQARKDAPGGPEVENIKAEDEPTEKKGRRICETVEELLALDTVFNVFPEELDLFTRHVQRMIETENQHRPKNKFTWKPLIEVKDDSNTTTRLKSPSIYYDLKSLIYKNNDKKEEALGKAYNITGERMNWPLLLSLAILETIRLTEKKPLKEPTFKFVMYYVLNSEKMVAAVSDRKMNTLSDQRGNLGGAFNAAGLKRA